MRARVAYGKQGNARFIGHLDLVNVVNRAVRRAGLPVSYSQGFTPRPRLAFGPPLPLFVEGERELVDIDLERDLDCAGLVAALDRVLPAGFRAIDAWPVDPRGPSITAAVTQATYRVTGRDVPWEVAGELFETLLARETVVVEKLSKGARKAVDLRPGIFRLAPLRDGFEAVLAAAPSRTVNILDLLGAIEPGLDPLRLSALRIVRTGCDLPPAPAP